MPRNSEWYKHHGTMPDGGPVYTETNPENFIAEPWNALSSLAFLIPAIYWLIKLRGKYSRYKFLTFCIPLLFAGGLGSTLFHAFRVSEYLLILDYLPIFILTMAVSLYLWKKIFKKWYFLFLIYVPAIIIRLLLQDRLPPHDVMNTGYFITGTVIFLPALLLLIKTKQKGMRYFIISLFLFLVSLIFRKIDALNTSLLPMGTHWLWHIFGAAGSFFLAQYLFIIEEPDKEKIAVPNSYSDR
jgi:hypothetical protein